MAINPDYLMDASKISGITTTTAIQGKGVEDMGMDDFFNLLVAQMTNQDMMNPAENTEMVAQMAQFSALQAMNTVAEYQQSTNALSYVGKHVTIADTDDLGKLVTVTGVVENVKFYDGKPQVTISGKDYDLYKVMEVQSPTSSTDLAGSALNSAASYIGKYVTLTTEDSSGMPLDKVGKVTSVTLKGGVAHVILNDDSTKTYAASAITDVHQTPVQQPAEEPQTLKDALQYIGKYVTVMGQAADGKAQEFEGYVESVEMDGVYAKIVLDDGYSYFVNAIVDVRASKPEETNPIPPAPENENNPADTDDGEEA